MPETEQDPVVVEFQRRRKNMLQSFLFAVVLIALGLAAKQVAEQIPSLFGIGHSGWSTLAIAQLAAGVAVALRGFLLYRCPVCEEIVRAHDKGYLGVAIDPTHCPKCGARLS